MLPAPKSLRRLGLCVCLLAGAFISYVHAEDPPDAVLADGSRYYGALVDGLMHGSGKLVLADKTYVGEFADGRFNGQGRFETSEGRVFEGAFLNGELHGRGRFTDTDGSRYEGGFERWQYHGEGTHTDDEGNVYTGTFVQGELTGPGRYEGVDGSRYEGDFKNWDYHGHGRLTNAEGDVYEGNFRRGYFHGEGVLRYAESRDGRDADEGPWEWGESAAVRQQAAGNVERALYAQGRLIDEALAALQPGDPARPDLYLLAVAGDGKQEVFRREVEFVRAQFDRDFHTRGRSLALINSRSTMDAAPMATLRNLEASLAAIAGRMDTAQDVLFLFLTSHGSAEHELTLDQNGMNLRGLPAATLAELLRGSGIKWKVVVVSACYAGGFIEPLKDEHTLVITAARADRTSFGCADENDFTYFGRAFFKEALPASASFPEAFDKAVALVTEWEADAPDHSEPQIAGSRAIREHLARWRAQLPRN